jgi:GT2 family glycosyltransferase
LRDFGDSTKVINHLFLIRPILPNISCGVPAWDVGAGANMAFRKTVFEKVGYFDERLDVGASGCSGDSEYWYRIMAEGFTCRYFPHIYVYHQHRESWDDLKSRYLLT